MLIGQRTWSRRGIKMFPLKHQVAVLYVEQIGIGTSIKGLTAMKYRPDIWCGLTRCNQYSRSCETFSVNCINLNYCQIVTSNCRKKLIIEGCICLPFVNLHGKGICKHETVSVHALRKTNIIIGKLTCSETKLTSAFQEKGKSNKKIRSVPMNGHVILSMISNINLAINSRPWAPATASRRYNFCMTQLANIIYLYLK